MDTAKEKNKKDTWLYEAFSEKGVGSAKRLAGMFLVVVSMACIVYLTIIHGATPLIQDLLQTSLITGAALLGLHSITSIWKNGSMSVGDGNVSYKGEDSKQVFEDVLNKENNKPTDDDMMGEEEFDEDGHREHHHGYRGGR